VLPGPGRGAPGQGGQLLAQTPQARFTLEEQFSDGSARAAGRWRYEGKRARPRRGHRPGPGGRLAESLTYVKG